MNKFLDNYFKLSENGTNTKQEFIAGITTFMTMAYILIVNPSILSAAGMDAGAIFTATASNTTVPEVKSPPIRTRSVNRTANAPIAGRFRIRVSA